MKRTTKYIAHIIIEAATPIAVGSGDKGFTTDRLIMRDANDLPYIPGTSLAGVIRHELEDKLRHELEDKQGDERNLKNYFGFQDSDNKKEGKGSDLAFSAAHLLDTGGKAIEGLQNIDFEDEYFSNFKRLPVRDHVRITDKGVSDSKKHGKFDEESVHKGSRFAFTIELEANDNEQDKAVWNNILSVLHQPTFRIGAGTRNGFGKFDVISCKIKVFDLKDKKQLLEYLDTDSSLNINVSAWDDYDYNDDEKSNWQRYQVKLNPESFYLFGAGYGDEDVDIQPKTESYFVWDKSGKNPKLVDFEPANKKQGKILIPATSVKGAIAHRVAYHFNYLIGNTIENNSTLKFPDFEIERVFSNTNFNEKQNIISEIITKANELSAKDTESLSTTEIEDLQKQINEIENQLQENLEQFQNIETDDIFEKSEYWRNYESGLKGLEKNNEDITPNTGTQNEAVKALFGYEKNSNRNLDGARGKVIISDVYQNYNQLDNHVFNHIAIDRFTGGGIDGALYSEKAVKTTEEIVLDIYVENDVLKDNIKTAFEKTLSDLTTGKLQLGGNTTKGHGAFTGTYKLLNQ